MFFTRIECGAEGVNMKINAIVAVYNKRISDVPLLNMKCKNAEVQFICCDNSTENGFKQTNAALASCDPSVKYVDMGGNHGLSKAYNHAVELSDGDAICFFDDDTYIPEDYFEVVGRYLAMDCHSVYLPLIYSNGKLLSPLKAGRIVIRRFKGRTLSFENCAVTGFNTGMFMSREIAKAVMHDEELFLDFVDHAFCRDVVEAGYSIQVVKDIELDQDYSRETDSCASALHRARIANSDVRKYYSRSIVGRLYADVYLFYLRLRNTLKFRTLAFFQI